MSTWVRQAAAWLRRRPLMAAGAVGLGTVLGTVGFGVVTAVGVFGSIASEDFEPDVAARTLAERTTDEISRHAEEMIDDERARLRAELEATAGGEIGDLDALVEAQIAARIEDQEAGFSVPEAVSPALPDGMFTAFLLIGADESGYLADAIVFVLLPEDGSAPLMVSLPRDLYLPNRCTGGYTKINANLGGCVGLASGSELLALAVQDFTGIEVDHFARVDFAGFAAVVDRLGGIEICAGEYPVRDRRASLRIDAGCTLADGATTLAWVRSRHPEYLVDGAWVARGGSDFDRQAKQQEVLFALADRLSSYTSVGALSGALESLASVVRTDAGLGIGEAASIGFRYRGIGPGGVRRFRVPVADRVTPGGAQVLIPVRSFNDVLADIYPSAAR